MLDTVLSILVFSVLASLIFLIRFYYLYRMFKKNFDYFIDRKSELFMKLNEFAKEKQIPLWFYLEKRTGFMPGFDFGKKIDWGFNPSSKMVEIPVEDLKFLSSQGDLALIEIRLAHELAHALKSAPTERNSLKEECKTFGQKSCLFDELRAYKTGLEIIDKIHGIKNWQPLIGNQITGKEEIFTAIQQIAYWQCPYCLDLIGEKDSPCPVKNSVIAQEMHIKRALGIKPRSPS